MVADADDVPRSGGIRLNWEINPTVVIAVITAIASATYTASQKSGKIDQMQVDMDRDRAAVVSLTARMEQSIAAVRQDIKEGASDTRLALAPLSDMRISMGQLAQRQQEWERWRATVDQQLSAQRDDVSRLQSDVSVIQRLSGQASGMATPRPPPGFR